MALLTLSSDTPDSAHREVAEALRRQLRSVPTAAVGAVESAVLSLELKALMG